MQRTSVHHGSFDIERTFRAPPARAFAAWADPELKALWFVGPKWKLIESRADFRVGGSELCHAKFADSFTSIFTAHYYAIIPEQLISYAYDMHVDGRHLSTSLATVEFFPTDQGGTRMLFTEQGAFYGGSETDLKGRDLGSRALLDRLVTLVDGAMVLSDE